MITSTRHNNIHISWLLVLMALLPITSYSQDGAANKEWAAYGGDKGSTKYSALSQINAQNADQLKVAWTWDSPDNPIAKANPSKMPGGYKVTPLVVNGVMYVNSTYAIVSAINPTTGETLWQFDPKVWEGPRPGNLGFNARGLAYWEDEKGNGRIILGTNRANLYAISAETGKLVKDFGDNGKIDLLATLRRKNHRRNIFSISPAIVANDVIVIGAGLNDRPTLKEMTPGDVRGFDVRTGELLWTFQTLPKKVK